MWMESSDMGCEHLDDEVIEGEVGFFFFFIILWSKERANGAGQVSQKEINKQMN